MISQSSCTGPSCIITCFSWNSVIYKKFVDAGVMIVCRELRYVWKGLGEGRPCTTLLKKFLGLILVNWEMILRLQKKLLWVPLEAILITRIKLRLEHANLLATSLMRLIGLTFFLPLFASFFFNSFYLINLVIFAMNHSHTFKLMIYTLTFLYTHTHGLTFFSIVLLAFVILSISLHMLSSFYFVYLGLWDCCRAKAYPTYICFRLSNWNISAG